MSLPELIEIVPLEKPIHAEITVPGSKSITNRALILAALAEGEVALQGALWSEDTQIMVECLQELGFMVNVDPDPNESCNRTITVYGKGGVIPPGGTEQQPLELFVGNAGTAARFLSAFVCLGKGVYRLHGVPRMHERPQAALFKALRELGYRIESENQNDKLPVKIHGSRRGVEVDQSARNEDRLLTSAATVSIEESSQFASALLLSAKTGNWEITITGENAEESPYVAMTAKLIETFPKQGGKFQIEPDASSGSYFLGAGWLFLAECSPEAENEDTSIRRFETDFMARVTDERKLGSVLLRDWPSSNWQIDEKFPSTLSRPSLVTSPATISRNGGLGDSIMTAIILAPFIGNPARFTDLGRLRVQECERVSALRTELTKCGAKIIEEGDTLTVFPSELHGAEIETYSDHRMAMCFSILGLKVPGIKIKNPACVKKTFPNFFQKLAALPPNGLGATILDAKTGRKLSHDELFAD